MKKQSMNCLVCNKEFIPNVAHQRYCSNNCRQKRYYNNHKEKVLERINKNYNPKKKSIYNSKYYYDNIDRLRKQHKQWQIENEEWIKIHGQKEFVKFRNRCRAYAKRFVKLDKCSVCGSKDNLERHHSKGYKEFSIDGVIVACSHCHGELEREERFGVDE